MQMALQSALQAVSVSPSGRIAPDDFALPSVHSEALVQLRPGPDRSALQRALDLSSDAVLIFSCATQPLHLVYANAAFERLTGHGCTDIVGKPCDWLLAALPASSVESVGDAMNGGQPVAASLSLVRSDGTEQRVELTATPASDATGNPSHYVMTLRPLAEASRQIEQLRFIANHDSLTGLPNRRLLLDRIDQALARHRRRGEHFMLAFLDLNELKHVNDRYGHALGDELLQHVARRLTASVRCCDTAARYGGDEFVLLLTDTTDSSAATQTVARILQSFDQPLIMRGQVFSATCSIGIASCPRDGTDASTLLHAADTAMYRAKLNKLSGSAVQGL